MDNQKPWGKIVMIGVVLIIAIVFIAYMFGGVLGAGEAMKYVVFAMLALAFLILAIGIVVWLFSKRKIDMVEHRRDQIIAGCKMAQSAIRQELWFKGDNNVATRKIGDVIGITKAYTAPEEKVVVDPKTKEEKLVTVKPPVMIFFIAFKNSPLPFVKPEIFCGVQQDFYGGKDNCFAGEKIFLNGTNFAPKIYDQFMLAHHWHDTTFIDKTASHDIQRYGLAEWNREFKDIGDSMINLDAGFVKTREMRIMEEIPGMGGE